MGCIGMAMMVPTVRSVFPPAYGRTSLRIRRMDFGCAMCAVIHRYPPDTPSDTLSDKPHGFWWTRTVSRLCPKRRRKPAETARKAAKSREETV